MASKQSEPVGPLMDGCSFHKGYASGVKERLRVVVVVGATSPVGSVCIIDTLAV